MRPRDHVRPAALACGPDARRVRRVAGIGRDHDRVLQERRAGGDGGELLRELAEGQVQRAPLDQPEGRGVPEGGRAAVAERDLVAVGQREQLAADPRGSRRPAPSRASAGVRCPSPRRPAADSRASASGRTFEGPQPKRPSAGFSSSGITSCFCSVTGLVVIGLLARSDPIGMVDGLRVPRRAAVLRRHFPVVNSTRAPVATTHASVANAARFIRPAARQPCQSASRSTIVAVQPCGRRLGATPAEASAASRQNSGAGPRPRQRRHSPSAAGSMPSPEQRSTGTDARDPGERATHTAACVSARRGMSLEEAVDRAGRDTRQRRHLVVRADVPVRHGRLLEHADRRPVLEQVPVLVAAVRVASGHLRRGRGRQASHGSSAARNVAEPRKPLGGRRASERWKRSSARS